jgi:hypothetical protein
MRAITSAAVIDRIEMTLSDGSVQRPLALSS